MEAKAATPPPASPTIKHSPPSTEAKDKSEPLPLSALPNIASNIKKYTGTTPLMKMFHQILFKRQGQVNTNSIIATNYANVQPAKLNKRS
jgi:hypothetical protein